MARGLLQFLTRTPGILPDISPALSAITVAELLFTARIVGAENFRYLEPMALCGLIYLVLSLVLAGLMGRLELRLRWGGHGH